jgi:hypothetical protein
LGEDAVAEEGEEVAPALVADDEVFELGREDGLDVLLVWGYVLVRFNWG